MILLKGTSEVLRVVTSASADIDTFASYGDMSGVSVTPGNQVATIATNTTTTIVSAPGSSVYRTVKYLSIHNRHASTSNTVRLEFYNGTTAYILKNITLAPGEEMMYDEANGWSFVNPNGLLKTSEATGNYLPAVNALNLVVLGTDVVNNNATANSIADVTGLSFSVNANETYFFRFTIFYTSASSNTGSRWTVNGPGITALHYRSNYALNATTETVNSGMGSYDLPASSNANSTNTTLGNIAIVEGFITPSASGTVIARFASEISSSAITAKAGSILEWVRTL